MIVKATLSRVWRLSKLRRSTSPLHVRPTPSAGGRCNQLQEEDGETCIGPDYLGHLEQLANPGRCCHICLRAVSSLVTNGLGRDDPFHALLSALNDGGATFAIWTIISPFASLRSVGYLPPLRASRPFNGVSKTVGFWGARSGYRQRGEKANSTAKATINIITPVYAIHRVTSDGLWANCFIDPRPCHR